VGLEVPESGDDSEAVVDGVASSAALAQYLPVFESGDDVFDAGSGASVIAVVIVMDGAAGVVSPRCGDRGDAAVATVSEDVAATEQVRDGVAGDDDVVAVGGPALAGNDHAAPVSADDDLGVDAAPVVLADGGDRLVVYRDQGAVDDPRVVAVVGVWPQCVGQHRHQMVKHAVDGGLAGVEEGGQSAGSEPERG
jgi:hypothetical protein